MKIKYEDGFRITGMQALDIDYTQDDFIIPMLWKTFTGSTWNLLEDKVDEKGIIAVSYNRQEDQHDYLIGICSGQKFGLPEFGVPNAEYAKFKIHGQMPEARNALYEEMKKSFQDCNLYEASEPTVLEFYSKTLAKDVMDLELWIPVKLK